MNPNDPQQQSPVPQQQPMQNPVPQQAPVQSQVPQQFAAPASVAAAAPAGNQFPFWYIPGVTIFAAKKGIATVAPGLLVVTDAQTGAEVYRFNLTPDLKISKLFGYARITFLGGQKVGMTDRKSLFYFYNPKLAFLSYLFMFGGASKAKKFIAACNQAAGVAV